MFLLITGASGAGKSSVRRAIARDFAGVLESAELVDLGVAPPWTLAWRHRSVEQAVQRALALEASGRHFLLSSDPVAPGEIVAAPSADRLSGELAVLLLDVTADEQRRRLLERGDDPALLPRHTAFADWMRAHVADPADRPDVIVTGGWEEMRWERWLPTGGRRRPWTTDVIDTSEKSPDEVARLAGMWVRRIVGS